MSNTQENILRILPAVNDLLQHSSIHSLITERGREVVIGWVRTELDETRRQLLNGNGQTELPPDRNLLTDLLVERILDKAELAKRTKLGRVINATGVILHTGLGRAPMSSSTTLALGEIIGAGNVEIDLKTGDRRYRGHQLLPAWQTLTGTEDALIVNNNAAATLLTLQTMCAGKEVVISRGQLIEIGGSFRLPEIFELSGTILKEVGTTNRTKLSDYEQAIGPKTAAIMHVHPSNYKIIGFSQTPEIDELAPLAHKHNLPVIDDIGSGALVNVTQYGLPKEPTFTESITHKADVVLGSGDKLLGGPQCGIIIGKHEYVEKIRQHPLARAVRVGKLTLAALSDTLDSYLRGAAKTEIPTLVLLASSVEQLHARANAITVEIGQQPQLEITVSEETTPVGGGSLPGAELPTAVLRLKHASLSANDVARRLRLGSIRLFCRVQQEAVLVDLRSVLPEDDANIAMAIRLLIEHFTNNAGRD